MTPTDATSTLSKSSNIVMVNLFKSPNRDHEGWVILSDLFAPVLDYALLPPVYRQSHLGSLKYGDSVTMWLRVVEEDELTIEQPAG